MPARTKLTGFARLGLFLLSGSFAVGASAASFSFVAIGDAPYQVPAQSVVFDRLINRINALAPAFTIHVGDFKSGSARCDDEIYARTLSSFDRFEQPLVYTPGDNEWTDCHRPDNGSYDLDSAPKLSRRCRASRLHGFAG